MRKPENEKLDEIGRMLVKAGATPTREIDKIVANPELFEGLQRRIAIGPTERPAHGWSIVRPGVAALAGVMLVAVATLAFYSLRSVSPGPSGVASVSRDPAPIQPSPTITRSNGGDRLVDRKLPPPADDPVPAPAKISSRTATTNVRANRPRRSDVGPVRFADDFYAVSYAGDPHETERGSRIVRVEIPRTTLFAMGINVPLENDSATVKADLLIGNDGVTRGIRIVE